MADPNWKRGFYYDDMPPHTGMKLARRESCGLEHVKKYHFADRLRAQIYRNRDNHLPLRARMGAAICSTKTRLVGLPRR